MSEPWLNPAWRVLASARATVVFVHGAIVDGWEMALLRRRIERYGYAVRQFYYQSMLKGLDENVGLLRKFVSETEGDVVHVVGHSMGGVLIREMFERTPDARPGRLVAIGSPLVNCWVGHRFNQLHARLGKYLVGKTVFDYIARPSQPVWRGRRDFGVLAGTYRFGVGALFSSLPSPSDGVILLEETKLEGLRDHTAFRLNHFGMLLSRRCAAEVARFLATGAFDHAEEMSVGAAALGSRGA